MTELAGERIVYRSWTIDNDLRLCSITGGDIWEREMVATCSRGNLDFVEPHEAPHLDCSCGLYGVLDDPQGEVVGAIAIWGRVEVGHLGIRAEHARVVLLAYRNDKEEMLVKVVAGKLGVRTCVIDDLKELAREYGESAEDLRELAPPSATNVNKAGITIPGNSAARNSVVGNRLGGSIPKRGMPRRLIGVRNTVVNSFMADSPLKLVNCQGVVISNNSIKFKSSTQSGMLAVNCKDLTIIGNYLEGDFSKVRPGLAALKWLLATTVLGIVIGLITRGWYERLHWLYRL